MSEQNKALVRRSYEEVWNKKNLNFADELYAANAIDHGLPPNLPPGREGSKMYIAMYQKAFPDTHMTIEDQIAEGDKVVTRWTAVGTHTGDLMGIAPTGKRVTVTGIDVSRFAGGRIVESWGLFDQMSMMQQLGVMPQPAQAAR